MKSFVDGVDIHLAAQDKSVLVEELEDRLLEAAEQRSRSAEERNAADADEEDAAASAAVSAAQGVIDRGGAMAGMHQSLDTLQTHSESLIEGTSNLICCPVTKQIPVVSLRMALVRLSSLQGSPQ